MSTITTVVTVTKSSSKLRQRNQVSNGQDKQSSSPLIIKSDKVLLPVKNNSKKNKKEKQQEQQQKPIVKLPIQKRPSASAPTTPQQPRKNILPVKARRVERRKEIKSMTAEAIKTETDCSSDDSSSSDSNKTKQKKKSGNHNKKKNNNNTNNNRPTPSVTTAVTLKKSQYEQQQQQRTRRRSSSVIDMRGTVYAGPTFNNAPLPSALPIPAFSPTPPPTTALVSLDVIKQQQLQRHSQNLMNILSSPQYHQHQQATVASTSHFERDLSEIQRGLRSMLKI